MDQIGEPRPKADSVRTYTLAVVADEVISRGENMIFGPSTERSDTGNGWVIDNLHVPKGIACSPCQTSPSAPACDKQH